MRIGQIKDAEIEVPRNEKEITVRLTGHNPSKATEIKMPAKSYEMLEFAVVERWLENKKGLIE